MFRNERDLLATLHNAVKNYNWFGYDSEDEYIKPLTKKELQELEMYRGTDGLLDFTGIKDMTLLSRLVSNVERKNALEEQSLGSEEETMQDYVTSLVDELMPLMGLREAHVSIETPSGKAKIDMKQGETPKVVYETSDDNKQENIEYTVVGDEKTDADLSLGVDLGSSKGDYTSVSCVEFLDDPVVLDENAENDETPADTETVSSGLAVKLYDCSTDHNPKYYHAVLHICETEHFPDYGVYGRYDTTPEKIDVAIILPTVWGKITSSDVDYFINMIKDNNTKVYVIDPETFELLSIETPFDLFDFEMTHQQEGVAFRDE